MQKKTLYRFIRPDGGVTVSTVKPDGDYTELSRLVADDGHILTDGEHFSSCTDTDNPDVWSEVEDAENPCEATAEDYENALRDMGVEV